jgi:hypothetical protein
VHATKCTIFLANTCIEKRLHNFSREQATKYNHQEGGADWSRTMDENFDPSRNMKTAMLYFQSGVPCSAVLVSNHRARKLRHSSRESMKAAMLCNAVLSNGEYHVQLASNHRAQKLCIGSCGAAAQAPAAAVGGPA